MVNYCRVLGCTNRSDREKHLKFFRLPKIIANQGEECKQLSEERRRLWLAKLHQDFRGKNLDNIRVCSQHFFSGTKAYLHKRDDQDWVPSLNMRGKKDQQLPNETLTSRYKRRVNRAHRKVEADASPDEPAAADSPKRDSVTDDVHSIEPLRETTVFPADVQQPSQMKEEQQEEEKWSSSLEEKPLHVKEEDDTTTFSFKVVTVKSEDEEEEEEAQPPQLHQSSTLDVKLKIEESSEAETDDSDDWSDTREDRFRSAGNISCSQCGKAFKLKSCLTKHMRSHTVDKPFRCVECGKKFRRKDCPMTHTALHEDEKLFSCTEGGKRFKFEQSVQTC